MRAVVQRVSTAAVQVDNRTVARIGPGLCAFVAVEHGDGNRELDWTARKLTTLRLFGGGDGRLDRNVAEAEGGVLLVPNFTVAGRVGKGTRPDFGRSAAAETAFELFEALARRIADAGLEVATGRFGADMRVAVDNDGPVTIVIEREPRS